MEFQKHISDEYLGKKIEKIKSKDFHPSKFKDLWEVKRKIIFENISNTSENIERYLKFAEIVHDKEFFSIDHIDQLGLPYDILIFLSEKNIGKSHDQIKRANEIINKGGRVVLMRSLEEHIKLGLANHLSEDLADFTLGGDCGLYHKYNTDPKDPKGIKKLKVGMAMALSTCIKWKGGSFDNVERIFFDEATDEHKLIRVGEFRKFFISVANSIERRKEDIKIEIYGNTDFNVSHPLFEVFDIDPEENFLYLKRQLPGAERETKILYINSRGLYPRGAKMSKFIGAISDPRAVLDAFNNKVKNTTDRLTSIDLTYLTDPKFAIIFNETMNQENQTWQLVVSKYDHIEYPDESNNFQNKKTRWYYIKCEPFNPSYLYGYKIFTSDMVLYSLYRSFCTFVKDETKLWIQVKRIVNFGKCMFIRRDTRDMLIKVLEKKSENPNMMVG